MSRAYDSDDGEQWAPVSDLMAALMLIFMFIAVIYISSVRADNVDESVNTVATQTTVTVTIHAEPTTVTVAVASAEKDGDKSDGEAETYRAECDEIYRELRDEFRADFAKWEARLDKNLTFRFSNPKVLFESGEDEITSDFKDMLDSFFPRYMRRIADHHLSDEVREIRIEGHTSSEWGDEPDEKKAYMENMGLSQERTRAILEYVLNLPEAAEYDGWARRLITANGLSSSRPVDKNGELIENNDGVEDKKLSRRVDFRLLTSACDAGEKKS